MYKTKAELEAIAGSLDDAAFEDIVKGIGNSRKFFENFVTILNAAEVRIMCAAASQQAKLVDPIFAAIERHRRAIAALETACARTDEIAAEQGGREVTEVDKATDEAASTEEREAMTSLFTIPATTLGGVRGFLEYVSEMDAIVVDVEDLVPTLLRSPIFAA